MLVFFDGHPVQYDVKDEMILLGERRIGYKRT